MKKYLLYGVVLIAYIVFFIFTFINIVPSPVFSSDINPVGKHFIRSIFMESFGFFTKDPKSTQYHLFEIDSQGHLIEVPLRNTERFNNYGLSRVNRKKLLELGDIEKNIKNDWIKEKFDYLSRKHIAKPTHLFNKEELNLTQIDKGFFLFVRLKPVIWEWRKFNVNQEIEYVYIKVQ